MKYLALLALCAIGCAQNYSDQHGWVVSSVVEQKIDTPDGTALIVDTVDEAGLCGTRAYKVDQATYNSVVVGDTWPKGVAGK